MFPLPRRKQPTSPLPISRFISAAPSTSSTYKDRPLRPLSLRLKLIQHLRRPIVLLALFLSVLILAGWGLGLLTSTQRRRIGGGPRVEARDWAMGSVGRKGGLGGALTLANGTVLPSKRYNETVLILTPMRNAIEHIWHYFHLLDQLTYPPELLHLGLLVSDTPSDGTYARALELADERQYSRKYRGKRWGKISVFQKDFAKEQAEDEAGQGGYEGENVGAERHAYEAQVGRRKLLAKSRTWLLTSALSPEVDHVLWLDVDLVDYEPQMVERLLAYGSGDLGEGGEGADVVVPNCVWKTYNEMGPYDRNNWIETPESLAHKATLSPTDVLIEGYPLHPTHRLNLASLVPSLPSALSPSSPYLLLPSFPLLSLPPSAFPPSGITLPPSLATSDGATTVPEQLDLDGVGGCAVLAKAEVHREGAVFSAWPPVGNQIETEGFAQLVKGIRGSGVQEETAKGEEGERWKGRKGRGRMIGLVGYYVYHGLYG